MIDYTEDYLLDKKIKIYQPVDGYRASSDAVLLAAAANTIKPNSKILDIGSGTGAISLCLAERFKKFDPEIIGVELQKDLVNLANMSAEANNFLKLKYINADIFSSGLDFCSFDHVFSNPPYFDSNMPTSPYKGKATAHTFNEKNLKDWTDVCIKMIRPQGWFYMINRAEALKSILNIIANKLGDISIFPLYSKEEQCAKRIIIKAKKDSKAPLNIKPPLCIHSNDGKYTSRAQDILRKGLPL